MIYSPDSDEEDNSWRQDDSVESEEESESSEEDLRKRVVTRTATKNVRAHGILKASNESVADRPALAMFTPMNGIKQEDKLAHDLSASAPASFLSKKKMVFILVSSYAL
jgi:isocitrate lyase